MGIFFKSEPLSLTINSAIEKAISINPKGIKNPQREAKKRSAQVVKQASGKLSWIRLILAVLLLVAILVAGLYADVKNLADWSKVLLHSFELLLGLVIGLLGGEAAAQR
jgi:hypothetical protein